MISIVKNKTRKSIWTSQDLLIDIQFLKHTFFFLNIFIERLLI
jgi:hypothetical protein